MTECYGDSFEFDIHNILREGDLSRRELFEWWLGKEPVFTCGRCEEEFSLRPSDIDEDDEILCSRCKSKAER
jgi:DNA-directed RNA polymerase subunit RPC12/RpoP